MTYTASCFLKKEEKKKKTCPLLKMVISDILGHTSGYVAKKYTQTCCKETHTDARTPRNLVALVLLSETF